MKLPIRMIVSDLDGTLLRDNKSISDYTIKTLGQCRKAGIKIVYATARGGNADLFAPSKYFDGRILMNGSIVYVYDTVLYSNLIPYKLIQSFLIGCDKQGIKIVSELKDCHYSNFVVSDKWSHFTNFKKVDFSEHSLDAGKIYAVVENLEDVDFMKKNLPDGLYMNVSRDGVAMVMSKEATKSNAIEKLSHYWGIKSREIVAFGDDLNDIDMLSSVGIGVAMENALEEIKQIAKYICKSNEEDGVAEWIILNYDI